LIQLLFGFIAIVWLYCFKPVCLTRITAFGPD